jgi:ubiquinone/menaquinone biosynthesis C-methylase UbiE
MHTYDDLPLWSAPFGLTLLETVRLRTGINVLDIGSGSGFPMLELAQRFGRSCVVYGLDPSPDAIRMTVARKEARQIINAKIIKGIGEEIPFPDKYFGLIVSNNGLNNVNNLQKCLEECFRVADHGAQLVCTMNLPGTMQLFYDTLAGILSEMGQNQTIDAMQQHIHQKRKPAPEIETMISDAGFTLLSSETFSFTMKFCDGTTFMEHSLIRSAFRPAWEEFLPAGQATEILGQVESTLNQLNRLGESLNMEIPYTCMNAMRK